jgi:hypothetical protein
MPRFPSPLRIARGNRPSPRAASTGYYGAGLFSRRILDRYARRGHVRYGENLQVARAQAETRV